MRVIMTGGGTGGHIYPAIAIADEIKRRDSEAQIIFVGAEKGLEKKIVPENGYELKLITVDGFNRHNLLKNIEVARNLAKGSRQAREIIRDFKPDFVVGTGGYASAPMVKMAQKQGIPTYIHEQNAVPGMTNKLLEKKARKVFLGFEKAGEYFKSKEKLLVTGNPVREEFINADRQQARVKLGFDNNEFVVLAFGGSQGAGRINKAMISVIKEFNGVDGCSICLGAGSYYYNAILHTFEEDGVTIAGNIRIMEYIHDMAEYIAASDLVICRSGALSVAETTVVGTPAIFIPSPIVTGDHQYYNAKAVAEKGGAIVVRESDLENEKLIEEIVKLRSDSQTLRDMSVKSKECGLPNAAESICDAIAGDYSDVQSN